MYRYTNLTCYVLAEIMARTGYNKSRIARESGVARRTITNLINGHTRHPSAATFVKLREFYKQLIKGKTLC